MTATINIGQLEATDKLVKASSLVLCYPILLLGIIESPLRGFGQ